MYHPGVPIADRRVVFEAPEGAFQTSGGVLKSGLFKKSDGSIGSKDKLKSSKKQLIPHALLKKAMKKEGVYEKGVFVPVTSEIVDVARKLQKKKSKK
jgi:hypothetical protein